jgi:hypothetical protein
MIAHKDLNLSCGCKIEEGETFYFFDPVTWSDTVILCKKHAILFISKKIDGLKEIMNQLYSGGGNALHKEGTKRKIQHLFKKHNEHNK